MAKQINNQINLSNFLNLHQEVQFFKGNKYSSNEGKKILFLGKSHYLPSRYDNRIKNKIDWYQKDANYFGINSTDLIFLNSKHIIHEDVIKSFRNNSLKQINRFHRIYKKIGEAYLEAFLPNKKVAFYDALEKIAFSNYFLRPSEKSTKSLKNIYQIDRIYAYEYLVFINQQLNPDYIIPLYETIVTSFKAIKSMSGYTYDHNIYNSIESKMKLLKKYTPYSFSKKELVKLLKTL
jgi:hypothetical protein